MGILLKRRNLTLLTDAVLVLIVAFVAAVCFAPPRAVPASTGTAYYNGDRSSNKISLMFNVYEGEGVVRSIMDVLDGYGVKATFFMGGCFADDHEELLSDIVTRGHELANHGYFHRDHAKLSYAENQEEIEKTDRVLTALSGVKPTLFAPPSGAFSADTVSAARALGYEVVMWSKDTVDWRDSDAELIFTRATKGAEGGDLVLMHPKEHTLKALPRILDYYKQNGLVQCTVSTNIFGE